MPRAVRTLVGLGFLLLAGCAGQPETLPREAPDYHLLASILMTETAGSGPVKANTGYFFYVRTAPPNVAGPMLEGYELRNGAAVDSFGGGSESAAVVEAILNVDLRPFDFDREVARVTAMLKARAAESGEFFVEPQGRDGAEWEIAIVTASGKFTLRAWNPGFTIDAYAAHSDDIRRLKATIDLLAQYYGRQKLGL